ncbi:MULTISPECIES: hypothetical protein [Actinoplanes]|uniref:hypothetical protein n=1 Tax=Actinoplanes TaxID=1865 RepID=UPI0006981832|nr:MULTISPECIES: hypothetical protein [Actinoplanes]GLY05161.1 hypothetical protein Acsp01_55400 [Actinoplanes sp. NBRC 101535]
MADGQQGPWTTAAPPAGYLPPPQRPLPQSAPFAVPPPRPVYREVHRVTALPVLAGLAGTTAWFVLFGALGGSLMSYAWWTIGAAASAWLVAVVLSLLGDRGVAVGIAVASGFGLSLAMVFVALRWIGTYDFPLW